VAHASLCIAATFTKDTDTMNLRTNVRSLLLGTVASLALLVGCGSAETSGAASSSLTATTGPQAEAGGRFRHAPDPARMIQRFDANGDGALQVSELPPPMQARIAEADANHDGVLAVDEITAHRAARRAGRFAHIDTNHDGAVTADEVGPERWAHLSAADADHDNRVTQAELETAFESGALRPPHGGHGDHEGPEGHGWMGRGGMGRGGMGGMHHGPDPAHMIQRFDANGDGALQLTEMPPRMQERMGDADTDHNGTLTEAELTAAIARHRAEHPEGFEGPVAPAAPVAPVAPAAPAAH
jgi:EF hand